MDVRCHLWQSGEWMLVDGEVIRTHCGGLILAQNAKAHFRQGEEGVLESCVLRVGDYSE